MFEILSLLLLGVSLVISLISVVCWIYTIVVAFQHGETLMGILSICALVGFVIGWINADKWNHKKVMVIWSIAFASGIILQLVGMALAMAMGPMAQ